MKCDPFTVDPALDIGATCDTDETKFLDGLTL